MAHYVDQSATADGEAEGSQPPAAIDVEMQQFIDKYKLSKIAQEIYDNDLTIDFLLSQTEDEIAEIAEELTSKGIFQKKFKYAVAQIKQSILTNNEKTRTMWRRKHFKMLPWK